MMSHLAERLKNGEFVVTSEVGPPKGIEIEKMLEEARNLGKRVTAINVTDLQSSVMRVGSLAVSRLLVENGLEPIYQLTCRDRNRIALQSDILTAYSLGIDNMLFITGDHIKLGDHQQAKPVFDIDSVQLIKLAVGLREGHDMVGNMIENPPDISIGAVVNPNFEPLELQLLKMQKKITI